MKAANEEEVIGAGEGESRETLTIERAFEMTLEVSQRSARGKSDWERSVKRFTKWLKKTYPKALLWQQINRYVLEKYMKTLTRKDPETGEKRPLAPNSRRLAVQPIVQTARRMAALYGIPNFADMLRIGNKPLQSPANIGLADALDLLDWIRHNEPRLEAGAALQALAGLRVTEAIRLTWDKVDLDNGLIEISGVTKNPWSVRLIPVCGRVLEALQRAEANRTRSKIFNQRGSVVESKRGYAFDIGSGDNYAKELSQAIRAWHEDYRKKHKTETGQTLSPVSWTAKDLRNVLPTLAALKGVAGAAIWEQYIGHAPRGISERHYIPRLAVSTKGEIEALEKAMQTFRDLVIEVIEKEAVRATQKKGAAEIESVPAGA